MFFFFKQKTAYEMRISDWSSDVCSSDLGAAYAQALAASGIEYDMLFGPAYKGIPLVTAVACAQAEQGLDVPYAYNRKEAKDHGEGGTLVGAPPRGSVVSVADVLTAGHALRAAVAPLVAAGGGTAIGRMTG